MNNEAGYICLLISGRIFEHAYGGEERFTSLLAEWLVRHEVDVILMAATFASVKCRKVKVSDFQEGEACVTKGKKLRTLNPPYSIFMISRFVMSFFWLLKIITIRLTSSIWLIHSQDTGYSGLAAIIAGKLLRIPVVLSSHGLRHKTLESIVQSPIRNFLLKIEYSLDMFTVKNADIVIAINPSIKNYLEKRSGRVVEYLPNCIRTSDFRYSSKNRDQIRQELGIASDSKVIGFIGRFSKEKNLETLIVSFANALQSDPDLKLVLVGTGSLEVELKNLIKTLGIERNVTLCGVRYDVARILSSFDIFVLPSFTEGLSTSLLEAMASKRAVICSDIEANRLLITHMQNGLLVDPKKGEELKEALQLLCKDENLRSALGEHAETTAATYDIEEIFSKLLHTYGTLRRK